MLSRRHLLLHYCPMEITEGDLQDTRVQELLAHPRTGHMNTLRDDITAALVENGITDFHFVRLHHYQQILERIAERFLAEGTKDLNYMWLWERFRHQLSSCHPTNALTELGSRLKPEERYWFLACEYNGKLWVADATGAGILSMLRQMYHFEYYIVDRHMTWLICENHHEMLSEASAWAPKAR